MFSTIIFLSTFKEDLPIGLALTIVPLVLGMIAAFFWFDVTGLKEQIRALTEDKNLLTDKTTKQEAEITDLRVRLSQAEAEVEYEQKQIRDLKNAMITLNVELEGLRPKKS